ncbi:MAG: molybdenum cofactor guanylyltransferase [Gammaproteobacteria bacterium]|nr:molybdenum cofactor guanylyltransferase [Gammaproteobacteria bacterium]
MSYPKNKICAVVLAGGMGRRLGGFDKGLLKKNGRPFVAHIIDQLAPQTGELLINANRNQSVYAKWGRVIADELSGYQGPLAGMSTAMQHCSGDWIVSAPCDSIVIAPDYVERLYQAAADKASPIAVAFDGERLQPVHALIHRSLLESLGDYLQSGERKIDRWYALHDFAKVDFSDWPTTFRNVNTPQDKLELDVE